jgi:hypothetical protein
MPCNPQSISTDSSCILNWNSIAPATNNPFLGGFYYSPDGTNAAWTRNMAGGTNYAATNLVGIISTNNLPMAQLGGASTTNFNNLNVTNTVTAALFQDSGGDFMSNGNIQDAYGDRIGYGEIVDYFGDYMTDGQITLMNSGGGGNAVLSIYSLSFPNGDSFGNGEVVLTGVASIQQDTGGHGGSTLQLNASDNGTPMYLHVTSLGVATWTTSP